MYTNTKILHYTKLTDTPHTEKKDNRRQCYKLLTFTEIHARSHTNAYSHVRCYFLLPVAVK